MREVVGTEEAVRKVVSKAVLLTDHAGAIAWQNRAKVVLQDGYPPKWWITTCPVPVREGPSATAGDCGRQKGEHPARQKIRPKITLAHSA